MVKCNINKNSKNILLAIGIVIFSYIMCSILTPMVYHTNDDAILDIAMSKAEWGETNWIPLFVHPFLSYILGILYIAFEKGAWWYIYQQSLIFLCIFNINYLFIRILNEYNQDKLGKTLILLAFNVLLFWPWISYVSFTATPVIIMSTIETFILSESIFPQNKLLLKRWLIIVIGIILAFMTRDVSALACIPYIMLCLLFYTVKRKKINIRTIVIYIIICSMIVGLGELVSKTGRVISNKIQGEDFVEYNRAKSMVSDYSHDSIYDNPELYKKIGWDEDIASLAWNFMMEEKNVDALKVIAGTTRKESRRVYIIESINYIFKDNQCRVLFLFAFAVSVTALLSNIFFFSAEKILCWFLNNIGACIIAVYMMLRGRWLYRVEYVIILPMCIINLFLIIANNKKESASDSITIKVYKTIIFLTDIICMMLVVFEVGIICDIAEDKAIKEQRQKLWVEYLNEHPESIFIEEVSSAVRFMSPRWKVSKWIDNLSSTGDWDWNTAAKRRFAENHGFSSGLAPEVFEKDEVYYVGSIEIDKAEQDSPYSYRYISYMMNHHNALGVAIIDKPNGLDDISIMHFVYEFNEDDYEQYYTISEGMIKEVKNRFYSKD